MTKQAYIHDASGTVVRKYQGPERYMNLKAEETAVYSDEDHDIDDVVVKKGKLVVAGYSRLLALLDQECSRRITAAYGKKTQIEEIFFRLRNDHTAQQDKERERLRSVKKQIEKDISSYNEQSITDDKTWST